MEAARIIRREYPGVRFGLLGYLGPENPSAIDRETLQGWVAEGTIEYIGRSDDVRPAIAEADCMVLPSYREGTPRTLLEGAAMGKPLIATDVPGCREVVEHGLNGYSVSRVAPRILQKIRQFLELSDKQRAAMSKESRKKAERQFDEKIVIRAYMQRLGC